MAVTLFIVAIYAIGFIHGSIWGRKREMCRQGRPEPMLGVIPYSQLGPDKHRRPKSARPPRK